MTQAITALSYSSSNARGTLRRQLRDARNQLTARQQQQAAEGAAQQLMMDPGLYRCRHLAAYLANDGELDPHALIERAWARGITVYLPVLHPIRANRMWFCAYTPDTPLVRNRFGILEPVDVAHRRAPWALDVVVMPLVGFDPCGGRLGMGGGFYDRTFAFKHRSPRLGPKLIGLGHDVQCVERLPVASWDIPLTQIVTGSRCYRSNG